jgi:hypothetical protein
VSTLFHASPAASSAWSPWFQRRQSRLGGFSIVAGKVRIVLCCGWREKRVVGEGEARSLDNATLVVEFVIHKSKLKREAGINYYSVESYSLPMYVLRNVNADIICRYMHGSTIFTSSMHIIIGVSQKPFKRARFFFLFLQSKSPKRLTFRVTTRSKNADRCL